jgi:hypothetical protein
MDAVCADLMASSKLGEVDLLHGQLKVCVDFNLCAPELVDDRPGTPPNLMLHVMQ